MLRPRWITGIVGLLVIACGIAATVSSLSINAKFSADPVCTRSISLATAPRTGVTCSIVAGTIASKFSTETQTSASHRITDHHIVVNTSDGPVLDVVLENEFWSRMYERATQGAPVVVETVNDNPAFIATSVGTLSASYDPSLPLFFTWVPIALGAGLLFVAIRELRPRPTRPSDPKSPNGK